MQGCNHFLSGDVSIAEKADLNSGAFLELMSATGQGSYTSVSGSKRHDVMCQTAVTVHEVRAAHRGCSTEALQQCAGSFRLGR